jgi:hypothetical protein
MACKNRSVTNFKKFFMHDSQEVLPKLAMEGKLDIKEQAEYGGYRYRHILCRISRYETTRSRESN